MDLETQETISQQLNQARHDASRRLEEAYQPKEVDMEHDPPRLPWMGGKKPIVRKRPTSS